MYNEDGDSHRIKTDLIRGVFEPQYMVTVLVEPRLIFAHRISVFHQ